MFQQYESESDSRFWFTKSFKFKPAKNKPNLQNRKFDIPENLVESLTVPNLVRKLSTSIEVSTTLPRKVLSKFNMKLNFPKLRLPFVCCSKEPNFYDSADSNSQSLFSPEKLKQSTLKNSPSDSKKFTKKMSPDMQKRHTLHSNREHYLKGSPTRIDIEPSEWSGKPVIFLLELDEIFQKVPKNCYYCYYLKR